MSSEEKKVSTHDRVRTHCKKLVDALNVIMDPNSTNQLRAEALQMCDGFKQTCPFCVPCGLKMSEKTKPPIYRHFGLQLLEHVIKFRWKFIFPEEKDDLKDNIMNIISKGTHECSVEESHIKDILARMVVELIKLEWPQQWPNLLSDLEDLCRQGETQTEIVMIILLRMTEDLVTIHTLPAELMYLKSTLVKDAKHYFAYVKSVLVEIVKKYKDKAKQCHRVGIATLNTVAGFLDWVAIGCITEQKCELLEMLCFLLDVPEVQLEAAECLCIAINRTGRFEDRKLLLYLFEDVPMNHILNASQLSDGESMTEKCYLFQKKLCMVMCALANLLCSLVGETNLHIPANFQKYLDSLIQFTTHSSLFLRSTTQSTWKSFLRHKVFSSDTVLLSKFPKYLQATTINLLKVGFPSKNDSPSCEYSRMDFDSDEEFINFFTTFCAQQGEVIRVACQLAPRTCFRMASEWLKSLLSAGTVKPGAPQNTPTPLQWDAMTFFFECVIQQLNLVMDKEDVPANDCLNLLQLLLNFTTEDPLILACTLSNMHTLFPFLTLSPQYLFNILSKLFRIVEQNKGPRPRAVKNARRHACSCIKELCQNNAELVLPNLEVLFNQVKQMLGNELMLTHMEKSTLMEALISVSNELKDHDAQREFLEELMAPVTTMWLSDRIKSVLSDPEEFLQYVGANDQITNTGALAVLNRQRISFCVSTILAVLKEARWPSEPDEAKAGGFVNDILPNGQTLYNNPCAPQIMKLLDNLLALINVQHNIHAPDLVARMSYPFVKALYRLEVTQPVKEVYESLHFISNTPVYKTENTNIQDFFYNLYSNCFKILGHACVYMTKDFYGIDDLADRLIKNVFANLDNVPDYKLTLLIRVFAKALVLFCPHEEYQALLAPVLGPFLTSLHVRLSARWHIIHQRMMQTEDSIADDFLDSPEYQQEKQVRILTRDVMGFISAFCLPMMIPDTSILDEESDDEEEDDVMETQTPQPSKEQHTQLSELGVRLMQEEDICSALMVTVFTSLAWNDSVTCQRTAIQLCWPLLNQMMPGTLFPNAVKYFFTMILKGLEVHGDYYFCRVDLVQLAFKIYVALRPRYEELKAVMEDVPDIDKNSLDKFDNELSVSCTLKTEEEARKDTFKRLIKGCYGKR